MTMDYWIIKYRSFPVGIEPGQIALRFFVVGVAQVLAQGEDEGASREVEARRRLVPAGWFASYGAVRDRSGQQGRSICVEVFARSENAVGFVVEDADFHDRVASFARFTVVRASRRGRSMKAAEHGRIVGGGAKMLGPASFVEGHCNLQYPAGAINGISPIARHVNEQPKMACI